MNLTVFIHLSSKNAEGPVLGVNETSRVYNLPVYYYSLYLFIFILFTAFHSVVFHSRVLYSCASVCV